MFLHRRTFRMVDIFGPGRCVWIRTSTESRKQIELQMIVRIDQSGKDEIAFKIQLGSLTSGASKRLNAAAPDFDIEALRAVSATSDPGARESHDFILMISSS